MSRIVDGHIIVPGSRMYDPEAQYVSLPTADSQASVRSSWDRRRVLKTAALGLIVATCVVVGALAAFAVFGGRHRGLSGPGQQQLRADGSLDTEYPHHGHHRGHGRPPRFGPGRKEDGKQRQDDDMMPPRPGHHSDHRPPHHDRDAANSLPHPPPPPHPHPHPHPHHEPHFRPPRPDRDNDRNDDDATDVDDDDDDRMPVASPPFVPPTDPRQDLPAPPPFVPGVLPTQPVSTQPVSVDTSVPASTPATPATQPVAVQDPTVEAVIQVVQAMLQSACTDGAC
eukprot:GILK01005813.1.p1 GENE.GILK01005813.1~~GILK01005813.1.p1  ORF type:complete len:282 (+),score=23.05 GILK01005813.1:119-964(+)